MTKEMGYNYILFWRNVTILYIVVDNQYNYEESIFTYIQMCQ